MGLFWAFWAYFGVFWGIFEVFLIYFGAFWAYSVSGVLSNLGCFNLFWGILAYFGVFFFGILGLFGLILWAFDLN